MAASLPQPQVITLPLNDNSNRAASTGYVDQSLQSLQGQIVGKAPLANPTFTGQVTTPTLALGGKGSTGDISTMDVVPDLTAPNGKVAKEIAKKLDTALAGAPGGYAGLDGGAKASMFNMPVTSDFSAGEGAYDDGVMTPRLSRLSQKAYAEYRGRSSIQGGTAVGQTLQGGGASEWFGPSGKEFVPTNSYWIAPAAIILDRLYVTLSAAPASGSTVTGKILINDVPTPIVAVVAAGQTAASNTLWPQGVKPGDRISVQFDTSANVQANAIKVSFGLGFKPVLTDNSFYSFATQNYTVTVNKPSGITDLYTEVPPWFLDVPQISDRAFLATTSRSYLVRTADNGTGAAITGTSATKISDTESNLWSYSYNGAYGTATANKNTASQTLLYFMHGENKNERFGSGGSTTYKQNTISAVPLSQACASGYDSNGNYTDCYSAYYAFVSLRTSPSNSGNGWVNGALTDMGPIAWPADGYVTPSGTYASNGVGHPTPYLAPDGYVYVFYRDSSLSSDGIKVVRAPQASANDPTAYRVYYKVNNNASDPANWANPSLPAGFTKGTANQYLAVKGNPSTPIAQHHTYAGRLAPSLVRGSSPPQYWAAQQYSPDGATWFTDIIQSTDLVNWSKVMTVRNGTSNGEGGINYPILADIYGNPQVGVIDANAFNILGTSFYTNNVNRVEVRNGAYVTP